MSTIEIRDDLLRALELRLEMYGHAVREGMNEVRDVVQTETMKRANASPRWVHVADYIDTWDENDRYWIGVRQPEFISEAQAAEYGTEGYPPDPILRTVDEMVRHAYNSVNSKLQVRFQHLMEGVA